MRRDHDLLLAKAAAPALEAIRRDRDRAPKPLRPLYDALAASLFEPDLQLEDVAAAAGTAAWGELRREAGQSAWSYIRDARLETAAWLLLQTSLSITDIGRLVGYDSTSSFRRALQGFLGMSASRYRREAPRRLQRAGALPSGAGTQEYWERMLESRFGDVEARQLDDYLTGLFPAAGEESATGSDPDGVEREPANPVDLHRRQREAMAEALAERLETLPWPEQRRLVRDAVAFTYPTLFDVLSRRSGEAAVAAAAASDDATAGLARGVELALLAIDSLVPSGLLEDAPGLAAQAWMRLARARWRAGDVAAADEALEQSTRDLERAEPAQLYLGAEAERSRVAAAFHWFRGRRDEARRLAEYSVEEHRLARSAELWKVLVLRAELTTATSAAATSAAAISAAAVDAAAVDDVEARRREVRDALVDLEEARGLLEGSLASDWAPSFGLWLRFVVALGDAGELQAALPEARRLASAFGDAAGARLLWFVGHCVHDAEPLWQQARQRFAALGDELWEAQATLDVARLRLAEGRVDAARAPAAELASKLGALATRADDLAAVRALGQAATPPGAVEAGVVDGAAGVLIRLFWERMAQRALRLAE